MHPARLQYIAPMGFNKSPLDKEEERSALQRAERVHEQPSHTVESYGRQYWSLWIDLEVQAIGKKTKSNSGKHKVFRNPIVLSS